MADSFDRSHHQPVTAVKSSLRANGVSIKLVSKAPVDLELWDAEREAPLFERIFARKLELWVSRR